MTTLKETHDVTLRSWVASANAPGTDSPVQNLPFAVFRRKGTPEAFRGGVAIGNQFSTSLQRWARPSSPARPRSPPKPRRKTT